jgi:16S rRNA (guanine966-N2)-methyltransferase
LRNPDVFSELYTVNIRASGFICEGKMARVKRPDNTPPGRLRIVAGKWRSRLLQIIDEPELRPTSERIRETLFNWLRPVTEGARCLDLFAGTGALGIEALSRGAAHIVFVEKSAKLAAAIRKNLDDLDATNTDVVQRDAIGYLRSADPQPFDIVFLDPPFGSEMLAEACQMLQENGWLAAKANIYLERGKDRDRPALPEDWVLTHEKVAGKVSYSLASTGTPT